MKNPFRRWAVLRYNRYGPDKKAKYLQSWHFFRFMANLRSDHWLLGPGIVVRASEVPAHLTKTNN